MCRFLNVLLFQMLLSWPSEKIYEVKPKLKERLDFLALDDTNEHEAQGLCGDESLFLP